ncbi:hypothetical protein [Rhizobium leguminosarum]|uniref:hypothetical protein n=1 Tax=Rhizobium leguminosarum TaxID=384 RepID=UPI001C962441|nr:hypothetical protein [Rhizobium leguminosarum]
MNSDVANKAATVCLLSLLAGCVSSGNRDVSHAVKALEGQPRQQALNAFGRPSLTTIKNGQSISYWPMAEVEQYLGPSNLRIVDGQTVVSETQGVKLKERRLNCVVKVTANAASTIIHSEVTGDAGGCAKVVEKLKSTERKMSL